LGAVFYFLDVLCRLTFVFGAKMQTQAAIRAARRLF